MKKESEVMGKCVLCLKGELIRPMQLICYACAAPLRAECKQIIKKGNGRPCNRPEHKQDNSRCPVCISQYGQQKDCTAPCERCHRCGEPVHEAAQAA